MKNQVQEELNYSKRIEGRNICFYKCRFKDMVIMTLIVSKQIFQYKFERDRNSAKQKIRK